MGIQLLTSLLIASAVVEGILLGTFSLWYEIKGTLLPALMAAFLASFVIAVAASNRLKSFSEFQLLFWLALPALSGTCFMFAALSLQQRMYFLVLLFSGVAGFSLFLWKEYFHSFSRSMTGVILNLALASIAGFLVSIVLTVYLSEMIVGVRF